MGAFFRWFAANLGWTHLPFREKDTARRLRADVDEVRHRHSELPRQMEERLQCGVSASALEFLVVAECYALHLLLRHLREPAGGPQIFAYFGAKTVEFHQLDRFKWGYYKPGY